MASKPTSLLAYVSSEDGSFNLGTLVTPDNSPVNIIGYSDGSFAVVGPTFELPPDFVNLEAYFTDYAGTYTGLNYGFGITSLNIGYAGFVMDTLTISVGAIPEPSTYAVLAGILGLGAAAYRRRRSCAA